MDDRRRKRQIVKEEVLDYFYAYSEVSYTANNTEFSLRFYHQFNRMEVPGGKVIWYEQLNVNDGEDINLLDRNGAINANGIPYNLIKTYKGKPNLYVRYIPSMDFFYSSFANNFKKKFKVNVEIFDKYNDRVYDFEEQKIFFDYTDI